MNSMKIIYNQKIKYSYNILFLSLQNKNFINLSQLFCILTRFLIY